MTHDNDHDFQQFRGAFDDAIMPDAAFKAKMEKMLQSEKPLREERISSVLASPSQAQAANVIPGRRSHPLMTVAAVMLVFAVVASTVWVLSGDVLERDFASSPGDVATLPADAPGMPAADVYLDAEPVPGMEDADGLFGIYDGVAVYVTESHQPPPQPMVLERDSTATPAPYVTDQSTVAVDMNTGERLWEMENSVPNIVAVSGDVLVISDIEQGRGVVLSHELRGVDLRSGEEIWTVSGPGDSESRRNSFGPVILTTDNLVALPASDGTIRAWDIQTGELAWEAAFDPGAGVEVEWVIAENETETIQMVNFSGTVWDDHFVLVNEEGTLQVLEPEHGKTVASHNLLDSSPDEFRTIGGYLQLYPNPNGVVLVRNVPDRDNQRTAASLIYPLSGDVEWTHEMDGSASPPLSIAADGSLAVNSFQWHSAPWYLRILGRSGTSTSQFFWMDENGNEILHTDPTDSRTYNYAVTDGTYACIRTEPTAVVCFDKAGTRHVIDVQLESQMLLIDGVLYIPTMNGVVQVDLP